MNKCLNQIKLNEKPVLIDEVNKLLQESLNKFLTEEKLDILGNPLPRIQDDFSWDTESFSFEFELGLAPEFTVDLSAKKKITQYNIVADDALIDKEIENLQLALKNKSNQQTNLNQELDHYNSTIDKLNKEIG